MDGESPFFLVVGLGNPGRAYEETRHNIGFQILSLFAAKQRWAFRNVAALQSNIAQGVIGEKKILLLQPLTYMNSSGEAVRGCVNYFKVGLTQMMVVCDDIAIPFGALRMKTCGSSGGHNGLKSIESHLGTQAYARLRVGVGDRLHGDLADYVLAPFKEEEKQTLPKIVEQAASALECWLNKGIVQAMQFANACQEEKKPEKNLGE